MSLWSLFARKLRALPPRRSRTAGTCRSPRSALPQLETLENRLTPSRIVFTGPSTGGSTEVRVWLDTNSNGAVSDLTPQSTPSNAVFADSVIAYPGFNCGVHVLGADIDGDGNQELVTAPGGAIGPSPGPLIKIWKVSPEGKIMQMVDSFDAYSPTFTGGVWLAAGDTTPFGETFGDKIVVRHADSIITGPGPGLPAGPKIKIFYDSNNNGKVSDDFASGGVGNDSFLAYEPTFLGGVRVAVGDINQQTSSLGVPSLGVNEIICAPQSGRQAEIRVFQDSNADGKFSDNLPATEIALPYPNFPTYSGGLNIASGDINGDGRDELVVGPDQGNPGPTAKVKIFSDTDGDGAVMDNIVDAFTPFTAAGYAGGVRVALGNISDNNAPPGGNGLDEVICAAGPNSGSPGDRVKIYQNFDGDMAVSDAGGAMSDSFVAYTGLSNGLFVGAGVTDPQPLSATYKANFSNAPLGIPDTGPLYNLDAGTGTLTSSITVPARAGTIVGMSVFVVINSQANEDVDAKLSFTDLAGDVIANSPVQLFHNIGQTVDPMGDDPDSSGHGFNILLADNTGLQNITAAPVGFPVTGTFNIEPGGLSLALPRVPNAPRPGVFWDYDASGTWNLILKDDTANEHSSTLVSWGINFTYAV